MAVGAVSCLCLLLLCWMPLYRVEGIRFASYNVQSFGKKKMNNTGVVDELVSVISRYDVVLLLEIRDQSNTSIHSLVQAVNSRNPSHQFRLALSGPQGRGGRRAYREQSAYLYRNVQLIESYQYTDPDGHFQRPPFCAKFSTGDDDSKVHRAYVGTTTGLRWAPCWPNEPCYQALRNFGIIGVHAVANSTRRGPGAATRTEAELDRLPDVYEEMSQRFGTPEFIIAGDMNADNPYVRNFSNSRLRNDPRFDCVTPDNARTNVLGTKTYDRIVLAGNIIREAYESNSAMTYIHQPRNGNITPRNLSDHHPVEMNLRTNNRPGGNGPHGEDTNKPTTQRNGHADAGNIGGNLTGTTSMPGGGRSTHRTANPGGNFGQANRPSTQAPFNSYFRTTSRRYGSGTGGSKNSGAHQARWRGVHTDRGIADQWSRGTSSLYRSRSTQPRRHQ